MDSIDMKAEKDLSVQTDKKMDSIDIKDKKDLSLQINKEEFTDIDLSNYDFPDSIKNGDLYPKLLEDEDPESDSDSVELVKSKFFPVSSKYLNFIKNSDDIKVLSDINQLIKVLESYRYWLVNDLPFELYELIILNSELVLSNMNLIKTNFLESYWKDIDCLIYFSKLDKDFKVIHHSDNNISKKRKIDDIIQENNKEYYFNEEITRGISLLAKPTMNIENETIYFYSHFLLSMNCMHLIEYFETKGFVIPRNICLMCARANNFEALKYFHEKGYSLYDTDNHFYDLYRETEDYYYDNITCVQLEEKNGIVIFTNSLYFTIANSKFGKYTDLTKCFNYCLEHYLNDGNKIKFDMLAIACMCNNLMVLSKLFGKYIVQLRNDNQIIVDIEFISGLYSKLFNYSLFFKSVDCVNFLISKKYRPNLGNLLTIIYSGKFHKTVMNPQNVFKRILPMIQFSHPQFSVNEINKIYYTIISNQYNLENEPMYENYLPDEDIYNLVKFFYDLGYQFTGPICCYAAMKKNELVFKYILERLDKTEMNSKILETVADSFCSIDILEFCIKKGCPINKRTYNFFVEMSQSNPEEYSEILNMIHQYYDNTELSNLVHSNIPENDMEQKYLEFLSRFYIEFLEDLFEPRPTIFTGYDEDDDDDFEPYTPTDTYLKVYPKA